jgi:flagellar export protein FliJ
VALIEADREVRVLEKLRERQLEQHRESESRREVRQIDEVAQRSARQVRS